MSRPSNGSRAYQVQRVLELTEGGKHVFEHYGLRERGGQYNPLDPSDSNPSFSVHYDSEKGRYFYKDFGDPEFKGDCFQFVKQYHDISYGPAIGRLVQELNLHEDDTVHRERWEELTAMEKRVMEATDGGNTLFQQKGIDPVVNTDGIAILPRTYLWEPEVDVIRYTALQDGLRNDQRSTWVEKACRKLIEEASIDIELEEEMVHEADRRHRRPILEFRASKKWPTEAAAYWRDHGHSDGLLLKKYGVLHLEYFLKWSRKHEKWFRISSKPSDPVFAYPMAEGCYKLYRPFNEEFKHAYMGNPPIEQPLFGFDQLPEECEEVILTASPKDVISFALFERYAVCMNSETDTLSEANKHALLQKVGGDPSRIKVAYDNDSTGTREANRHKHDHGFTVIEDLVPHHLHFPSGEKVKDLSDWILYMNQYEPENS
jgi:hypothetical protein